MPPTGTLIEFKVMKSIKYYPHKVVMKGGNSYIEQNHF